MFKDSSFKKTPLTEEEKLAREKAFVSGLDKIPNTEPPKKRGAAKKEPQKTLYIRAPESFWNDIQEIMELSGLTLNAVCLELLRPAIKKKLIELKS